MSLSRRFRSRPLQSLLAVLALTLEALLTLLSALLGAGLAAALLPPLVGVLGSFFFGGTVVWQPLAAFVAVGLTALLGSVLSLVPALQTVRAAPVEGLRSI